MCQLCNLEKLSKWYYEDEDIIVCDCLSCKSPQVVWKKHSMSPPAYIEMKMITKLNQFAKDFYCNKKYYIDTVQRTNPNHLHYHARYKNES